ncbi:MAG TPA: hypothetical protein VIK91_13290 [Nannocystis sp.]
MPRWSIALVFAPLLAGCFNPSGTDDPTAATSAPQESSSTSVGPTSDAGTSVATTASTDTAPTSTTTPDPTSTTTGDSSTSSTDATTDHIPACGDGVLEEGEFCYTPLDPPATDLVPTDVAIGNFLGDDLALEILIIDPTPPQFPGALWRVSGSGTVEFAASAQFHGEQRLTALSVGDDASTDVAAFATIPDPKAEVFSFTLYSTPPNSDTWNPVVKHFKSMKYATWLTASPLDGIDGIQGDIVVTDDVTDTSVAHVWVNPMNSDGELPTYSLDAEGSLGGCIGDFDHNGFKDLAVLINKGVQLKLFLGQNSSNVPFIPDGSIIPLGSGMTRLVAADLDGQPGDEIFAAGLETCLVWSLDTGSYQVPCGDQPVDLAVHATNIEILLFVADAASSAVHVLRAVPGEKPAPLGTISTQRPPRALALGDLNNDGFVDVAVATEKLLEVFLLGN